jgi:hypothetical protein
VPTIGGKIFKNIKISITRQAKYCDVILRRVRATIVAEEKYCVTYS